MAFGLLPYEVSYLGLQSQNLRTKFLLELLVRGNVGLDVFLVVLDSAYKCLDFAIFGSSQSILRVILLAKVVDSFIQTGKPLGNGILVGFKQRHRRTYLVQKFLIVLRIYDINGLIHPLGT